MEEDRREKVKAILLFLGVIILPFTTALVFLGNYVSAAPYEPEVGEQVNYWWLIFRRTSLLANLSTCIWISPIVLVLIIIGAVSYFRHREMNKVVVTSVILTGNILLCSFCYMQGAVWFDGTLVDHISSMTFKDKVYQLAIAKDYADAPLNAEYIVYACQPPGLWCEVVTSIKANGPDFRFQVTGTPLDGSFVIEQDKLYVKVGQDMSLISG